MEQNSEAWHELKKDKVTGSRLAVLLGFHARDKFRKYWLMVKNGLK